MSINVSGVDQKNINEFIRSINIQKAELENKINSAKADFEDNGFFDATAEGSEIGTTDLTMDAVNGMSFDEINELMQVPSETEINKQLDGQQQVLTEELQKFENLKNEIENLQNEINNLQNDIKKYDNELKKINATITNYENKKTNEEKNYRTAQNEYNTACKRKGQALEKAEKEAYDEAIEEYANRCSELKIENRKHNEKNDNDNSTEKDDESDYSYDQISFAKILNDRINSKKISASYDSNITFAAEKVANSDKKIKRYEKLIIEQSNLKETVQGKRDTAESSLGTKKDTLVNKEIPELQAVEKNIGNIEGTITNLQAQMAKRNFVNENKDAIENLAYQKDPQVIECKNTISNSTTNMNTQLKNAQDAEKRAQEAALMGNKDKAEEEKQKAEEAKQLAETEKRNAENAKAELVQKYGKEKTKNDTDGVDKLANIYTQIENSVTNAKNAITNAGTIANALNAISTNAKTVADELANVQVATQAAEDATAKGDETTAITKLKEAQEAKKRAEDAQKAAKAAEDELKKLNATDQKASEMAVLNTNVSTASNLVNGTDTTIKNMKKDVESAETRKSDGVVFTESVNQSTGETETDVHKIDLASMISAEELNLVRNNNIDLTAYDAKSGYPYYIIAKGKHDNKWHIYQREFDSNGNPSSSCTSLARKYGQNQGYSIVSSGNGYMYSVKEVTEGTNGAQEIYYLTCVSEDFKSCKFGNAFKTYGTSSPISLDLNGDGIKTSDNIISYDIDGDGVLDRINDSADAVLVFDKDGDGVVGKDGSECFGNNTDLDGDGKADGYKDGFEALKALGLKEELINNKDDMQLDEKDIKFLEENYGFKIKVNGYNSEAQSLADFGITVINLARTNDTALFDNFDGRGNQLMTQEGATFVQNGTEKEYADIWHRHLKEDKKAFLGLTLTA